MFVLFPTVALLASPAIKQTVIIHDAFRFHVLLIVQYAHQTVLAFPALVDIS